MTDDKAGRVKSELSARGMKRDVENTPKCTRPNCIPASRSHTRPCRLYDYENYNDDDYENGYDKNNEGVAVAERSPVCKTLKSFPKQWERAAQLPRL